MSKFKVQGLLKPQYRGGSQPTLKEMEVSASNPEEAMKKFEKDDARYQPNVVNPIGGKDAATDAPPLETKATLDKESTTDGSKTK